VGRLPPGVEIVARLTIITAALFGSKAVSDRAFRLFSAG